MNIYSDTQKDGHVPYKRPGYGGDKTVFQKHEREWKVLYQERESIK